MSAAAATRRLALSSAKRLIERSLVGAGLPKLARARRRADTLVLAYHNIVPRGETAVGDLSLHLPQSAFADQLDALLETHDIVPLTSILEEGDGSRPRLALTFDDAYAGTVTAGIEEVARRGLPATIFVPPAFVGGGTFWWDEIADTRSGEVRPEVRAYCLWELKGRTPAIQAWAASAGIESNALPEHQRCAEESELVRVAGVPGLTLAAHTWSHANLAALEADELEEELVRPMAWLRERFAAPLPWVTYPYGLHSPEVERATIAAGYRAAMRVDGGWLLGPRPTAPRSALPRMNIPAGLSLRGFTLRTAGVKLRP
ncbi:MAG TPA: polysaccharide deacetylase family protein [Longimicrobiaceae bacterium]